MSEAGGNENLKIMIGEVDSDSKNKPSSVNSSLEAINKFKGILEWVNASHTVIK